VIQKITPSLWFADEADEAARFYTSLFPNSRVERITSSPAETPSVPAGSAVIVEFTLAPVFGGSLISNGARAPLQPAEQFGDLGTVEQGPHAQIPQSLHRHEHFRIAVVQ